MEETIKLEMTKTEVEQFKALIETCLEQMRQSQARMDEDQREIDRLKAETRAMLKQINENLNVETVF